MKEKILIVLGILLVIAGALALYYGGIPEERHAIEIGSASIGWTEMRDIPAWAGWASIVIGAVLTTLGFTLRGKPSA